MYPKCDYAETVTWGEKSLETLQVQEIHSDTHKHTERQTGGQA